MSELLWLAALPALVWLLVAVRRRRQARVVDDTIDGLERISVAEMDRMVNELSPTLQPPTRVTSPNYYTDSGHVWDSPSGKRVYMN
jgi:hypothetical protein